LLISLAFEQLAVDGGAGGVVTTAAVDGAGGTDVDVGTVAVVDVVVDGRAGGGRVADLAPPHPVADNAAAATARVATTTAGWWRASTGRMLTVAF
jgi:hypothetical protein